MAAILESTMRLLHPFMPFLSEEIWGRLPKLSKLEWRTVLAQTRDGGAELRVPIEENAGSLCVANWPIAGPRDEKSEADFELLQDAIRAARNLRAEAKIAPGRKLNITFIALNERAEAVLREGAPYLTQLANLEAASIVSSDVPRPQNALSTSLAEIEIFLPLEGLIDVAAERARLEKQLETAQKELENAEGKLSNPNFTARAKPEIVAKEEGRRADLGANIEKLRERIQNL